MFWNGSNIIWLDCPIPTQIPIRNNPNTYKFKIRCQHQICNVRYLRQAGDSAVIRLTRTHTFLLADTLTKTNHFWLPRSNPDTVNDKTVAVELVGKLKPWNL